MHLLAHLLAYLFYCLFICSFIRLFLPAFLSSFIHVLVSFFTFVCLVIHNLIRFLLCLHDILLIHGCVVSLQKGPVTFTVTVDSNHYKVPDVVTICEKDAGPQGNG